MLILIRGISGSGKSTTAKEILKKIDAVIFEADQYFMRDGKYKFNPGKLADAHLYCQNNTYTALLEDKNVIVSNTFTRFWEMEKYLLMAKELGVSVCVLEKIKYFGNQHGLTDIQIKRMQDRFEGKNTILEKAKKEGYEIVFYREIEKINKDVILMLKKNLKKQKTLDK